MVVVEMGSYFNAEEVVKEMGLYLYKAHRLGYGPKYKRLIFYIREMLP